MYLYIYIDIDIDIDIDRDIDVDLDVDTEMCMEGWTAWGKQSWVQGLGLGLKLYRSSSSWSREGLGLLNVCACLGSCLAFSVSDSHSPCALNCLPNNEGIN